MTGLYKTTIFLSASLTLFFLPCASADVMTPLITPDGLFSVGQEGYLLCSIIADVEVLNSFPLTWSRGGSNLTAYRETARYNDLNVNESYDSSYRFTVQSSDQGAVFTCTAHLPSGTASSNWTLHAYQEPVVPIISGPTAVVSDVSNSWRCVVYGASTSPPSVYWQFGNGSRLPTDIFNTTTHDYRDINDIELYEVTSVLTLSPSAVTTPFELVCVAVPKDSRAHKNGSTSLTVLPEYLWSG